MKNNFLLVALLIASTSQIFAQTITLNPEVVTNKLTVGTPSAITSAVFEANSTTKGILIPRMTTVQRNALIPTAVTGLMVYDTDLKDLYIFNGFWKRATIGELPISLFGNIANQGIVYGQNDATFGIGLHGTAATGTGLVGITNSGTGVNARATTTGVGGFFEAQTGIAVSAANNSNFQATARLVNSSVGGKGLDVTGSMTLTTDIASGNAIIATNSNSTGTGVRGVGGTFGVYGLSANTGVIGDSFAGRGIEGNSQSGNGVGGFATTGIAGLFQNNTNTNPTIKIQNNTSGGTALEINGAVKVSGTNPAAFKITSTVGNITNGSPTQPSFITIPNTTLANNATDILIVTHAFGTYLNKTFGVFWNSTTNSWTIYLEELNTNMPVGTVFNVLVIKQ